MRNADAPKRAIGIAFDRVIGTTQERSALAGVSFTRPRYVSEFPQVEIDQYPGSLLHFFPYASVTNDMVDDEVDMKFGADMQWKPSGNFQLTAALDPDFGQVEADELVVNFDAIEALFSDKRPFFAENQALFDVRVPETDSQRLTARDRLLYTRRIGGQRDDDPTQAADIDGAVKLNGNVGRLDYGVLSAVESDYSDDLGRAFAGSRLLGVRPDHARLPRHLGRSSVPRAQRAGALRRFHLASQFPGDADRPADRQHDRPVGGRHLRRR